MKQTMWILAAVAILTIVASGCKPKDDRVHPTASPLAGHNVLLVTYDTTRADRIGCYGCDSARTPATDALAARGVLFERAYAQVPLTLPSHCSLMTGRYPRELGVRDNGRSALAEQAVTLADRFKEHGYRTGAFIASFVIASPFGLSQGFDAFDDDMQPQSAGADRMKATRPADVVTDRALEWLQASSEKPFFGWVHYYDPHEPYTPPPEYRDVGSHPYDGEIAFMDAQFERLTDWIDRSGATERTLIIVAGDHGESFGEHGEHGHALLLYETNLRVPLIFAHPSLPSGSRVSTPVELVDVFPTLLDLLSWDGVTRTSGRSLTSVFRAKSLDPIICYAESIHAYNVYRWAQQIAVIDEQWKYIASTKPELYDLVADPGETNNLVDTRPAVAESLRDALEDRYEAMRPGQSASVGLTDDERQALESLGYLSGSGAARPPDQMLTPGLPDPKDLMDLVNALEEVPNLVRSGRYEDAIPALEQALARSPESPKLLYYLGACYLNVGQIEAAVARLKSAVQLDPAQPAYLTAMGDALIATGKHAQAVSHYEAAIQQAPWDAEAHYKLGQALERINRSADAEQAYRRAIRRSEANADAHRALGVVLMRQGKFDQAGLYLHQAVQLAPEDGKTRLHWGVWLARQNRTKEAIEAFRAATLDAAVEGEAWYNLGVAIGQQNRPDEALAMYEKALAADPAHARAAETLASIYLFRNRHADAVSILEQTVEDASDVRLLNLLARVLATSRNDAIRNGTAAVEYAKRACELTAYRHPAVLGTLAAAHAEAGDFDTAQSVARRAIETAGATGDANLQRQLRDALDNYRRERPLRSTEY